MKNRSKRLQLWRPWARWQARLTLLQRVDTWLFGQINNLPHPPFFDNGMRLLAELMNRGDGWLFGLFLVSYHDERQGHTRNSHILRRVAPVLWLASATVEFPLKSLFRRQRPYVQLTQAILVGAPPQRHSFPSGHAASAFAGAWLLSAHYPRWRLPFYLLATAVAFCRVYLGVHYPSDVIVGGLTGVGLAAFYQRLINHPRRRWRLRPPTKPATPNKDNTPR
ncbi:MAG: phosphatase PAP2 family protein [Caldilineaceae bacterium]|nr:phosphatase PAP2 family protein [Caldilineaceae bacterium]